MKIAPLHADVTVYLRKRQLLRKWDKASRLFETNIRHPSLNTELMEPHWRGVYSFRIDKKYRAMFLPISNDNVEIIGITNHYK